MTKDTHNASFLKKGSHLRNFLAYPRFLLSLDLSESAKLIYILLLDRARMAARKEDCTTKDGNLYIFYHNTDLCENSGKSSSTVKAALRELEQGDLIYREPQIDGQPRRIFIKTIEPPATPKVSSAGGRLSSIPSEGVPTPAGDGFPPSPGDGFSPYPRTDYRLPPGRNLNCPPGRIPPQYYNNNKNNYKNNSNQTNYKYSYTYEEGESL